MKKVLMVLHVVGSVLILGRNEVAIAEIARGKKEKKIQKF